MLVKVDDLGYNMIFVGKGCSRSWSWRRPQMSDEFFTKNCIYLLTEIQEGIMVFVLESIAFERTRSNQVFLYFIKRPGFHATATGLILIQFESVRSFILLLFFKPSINIKVLNINYLIHWLVDVANLYTEHGTYYISRMCISYYVFLLLMILCTNRGQRDLDLSTI